MIVDPSVQVPYTLKADIWSFAMVTYEILTLQLPYGNFHMTDAVSRIQKVNYVLAVGCVLVVSHFFLYFFF